MEPEKTPRERAEDLIRLLVSDWRPTAVQILWAIRIAVAVAIVLGVLALIGSSFGITLWDWLRVLAVPITIGVAVPWLNWLQKKRELAVELQRAQLEALQGYLDGMSQLLTDKELPLHSAQPGDGASIVARTLTITILSRLDGGRRRSVLEFLYESGLINRERVRLDESKLLKKVRNIVSLDKAYLRETDLRRIFLDGAALSGADLSGADLSWAFLMEADLSYANLSGAYLRSAALSRADLSYANLSGAILRDAILRDANLNGAKLIGTDLRGTVLDRTDLTLADFRGAQGIRNEEIERQAKSLDHTRMPDGQLLIPRDQPDPLSEFKRLVQKGGVRVEMVQRGRVEDGENSGPS